MTKAVKGIGAESRSPKARKPKSRKPKADP